MSEASSLTHTAIVLAKSWRGETMPPCSDQRLPLTRSQVYCGVVKFYESGAARTRDMEVHVLKMEVATEVHWQGSIIHGDDDEMLGDSRLSRDSVIHGGPTQQHGPPPAVCP